MFTFYYLKKISTVTNGKLLNFWQKNTHKNIIIYCQKISARDTNPGQQITNHELIPLSCWKKKYVKRTAFFLSKASSITKKEKKINSSIFDECANKINSDYHIKSRSLGSPRDKIIIREISDLGPERNLSFVVILGVQKKGKKGLHAPNFKSNPKRILIATE